MYQNLGKTDSKPLANISPRSTFHVEAEPLIAQKVYDFYDHLLKIPWSHYERSEFCQPLLTAKGLNSIETGGVEETPVPCSCSFLVNRKVGVGWQTWSPYNALHIHGSGIHLIYFDIRDPGRVAI